MSGEEDDSLSTSPSAGLSAALQDGAQGKRPHFTAGETEFQAGSPSGHTGFLVCPSILPRPCSAEI